MRIKLLLFALFASLMLAACGGDDGGGPTPAPTATGEATSAAGAPTRETAEASYIRGLCERDTKFATDREAIPETSQDPSSMTLAERRTRGEALWPALAELYEAYVAELESVTPPDSAAELHQALLDLNRSQARELRRSIAEIDAIFVSQDSLNANNDTLRATEEGGMQGVDRELRAAPSLLELYQTLPECGGSPAAEATPG
jgi:hypothetical protein